MQLSIPHYTKHHISLLPVEAFATEPECKLCNDSGEIQGWHPETGMDYYPCVCVGGF